MTPWRALRDPARATARPKISMDDSSASAAPGSASMTSPISSAGTRNHSRLAGPRLDYTLNREEPNSSGYASSQERGSDCCEVVTLDGPQLFRSGGPFLVVEPASRGRA